MMVGIVTVVAKAAGVVESSESNRIVIREEDGNRRVDIQAFLHTYQNTNRLQSH